MAFLMRHRAKSSTCAGNELPPHEVPGDITVQCLEGKVKFTVGNVVRELTPGTFLHLSRHVDEGHDERLLNCRSREHALRKDVKAGGAQVRPTAVRAPNENAYIERFVQTIKLECLSWYLVKTTWATWFASTFATITTAARIKELAIG
jgi:hypothetical protein